MSDDQNQNAASQSEEEVRRTARLLAAGTIGCMHYIEDDQGGEAIVGQLHDLSREGACIVTHKLSDADASRLAEGAKLRCVLFSANMEIPNSMNLVGRVRWFKASPKIGEPTQYGISWVPRGPFDQGPLDELIAAHKEKAAKEAAGE